MASLPSHFPSAAVLASFLFMFGYFQNRRAPGNERRETFVRIGSGGRVRQTSAFRHVLYRWTTKMVDGCKKANRGWFLFFIGVLATLLLRGERLCRRVGELLAEFRFLWKTDRPVTIDGCEGGLPWVVVGLRRRFSVGREPAWFSMYDKPPTIFPRPFLPRAVAVCPDRVLPQVDSLPPFLPGQ